ncbi:hypothetical protein HYQ45_013689 [Verticillium longisporum]|uniref:C3H1-type domain-containing protein n=1 Tax=Verticillium longisporum TaxID=100787 RepID=A0A8I2ZDL3_VERLO|nr:hypothetical protein HYQ45_013689 [Verticillium longisporum]
MKQQAVLVSFAASLPTALAWIAPNELLARDDDIPYQDIVCKPETSPEDDLPPCVSIEIIETACLSNGTDAIHYEAHAQCMCNGSFFPEKLACERCHFVHGLRSGSEVDRYEGILAAASNALCDGNPTAPFASLFASAEAVATPVSDGATGATDQFVSETDVSLYYTATGDQGAGTITGDAASATATTTNSPPFSETPTTGTASNSGEETRTTTSAADESETSGTATEEVNPTEEDSGAIPTQAADRLVLGLAGMALLAAV